jgi:hypothetical protein
VQTLLVALPSIVPIPGVTLQANAIALVGVAVYTVVAAPYCTRQMDDVAEGAIVTLTGCTYTVVEALRFVHPVIVLVAE